jgi:hypothetical protein
VKNSFLHHTQKDSFLHAKCHHKKLDKGLSHAIITMKPTPLAITLCFFLFGFTIYFPSPFTHADSDDIVKDVNGNPIVSTGRQGRTLGSARSATEPSL